MYQFPAALLPGARETLPAPLFSALHYLLCADDPGSFAYMGVNAGRSPQDSYVYAQQLLSAVVDIVSTHAIAKILLLCLHPEDLFDLAEILPLFALLERVEGSLFVAARSLTDFGGFAQPFLCNARTVITHRGMPSSGLLRTLTGEHPSFERRVRTLPDNECFVLYGGQATHVRLDVPLTVSAEEEYEDLVSSLIGSVSPVAIPPLLI
jgi:hypothetical protein